MGGPPAPLRVSVTLDLYLDGSVEIWGVSRDLSVTGLLAEAREHPPVGSEHTLRIRVKDNLYSCRCRVSRHTEDAVALAFIEPDAAFTDAIDQIVQESPPSQRQWEGYETFVYWG